LGEETNNETAEYAEGFDANAIKYEKYMANDVTDATHYQRLGCFCYREERIKTKD
jgi:hypothetical protein